MLSTYALENENRYLVFKEIYIVFVYDKCKPNVSLYVGRSEKQKTNKLYHKSQETEYLDPKRIFKNL